MYGPFGCQLREKLVLLALLQPPIALLAADAGKVMFRIGLLKARHPPVSAQR